MAKNKYKVTQKPSDGVVFLERIMSRTFHVDLIIFVEVDSFLNCLEYVIFIFRQRRWYINWNTFFLS